LTFDIVDCFFPSKNQISMMHIKGNLQLPAPGRPLSGVSDLGAMAEVLNLREKRAAC
jgi:hypothetical protein